VIEEKCCSVIISISPSKVIKTNAMIKVCGIWKGW